MTAKFSYKVLAADEAAVLEVVREHQPCNSTIIAYKLRERLPADLVVRAVIRLVSSGQLTRVRGHGYKVAERPNN